jgi:zinc/manganese transport system substrate-binding protein
MRNYAFALFAVATLAAPARSDASLRVVTTSQDLAYLARAVGGQEVEATSLLKGYQDLHFASAKPSYMVEVSRADLMIFVGLDLEIGWLPLILQGARNPGVMPGSNGLLDASQFVTPIEVPPAGADRSKGDLHPKGNPHYWLAPENAKKVARGIAERLTQIDPAHASAFEAGLKALLAEIDRAESEARAILSAGPVPPVVTYHVTHSYFLGHFGLASSAFIEPKPGIPPSPAHVAGLATRMKAFDRPAVILVEPFYDQDVPKRIAEQTGARVVVTPSSIGGTEAAKTYRDLLVEIARAIRGS